MNEAKRNKVIKGLQCCSMHLCKDGSCPYYRECHCESFLAKDALDIIEEEKWISVTERLPKPFENVYLWDGYEEFYGRLELTNYGKCWQILHEDKDRECYEGLTLSFSKFSHWYKPTIPNPPMRK